MTLERTIEETNIVMPGGARLNLVVDREIVHPGEKVKYPRPVTEIHQIEPTERCNLRCTYCPSPKLDKLRGRPGQRIDMTWEHFERTMEWVSHFHRQGTQRELSFTGIGESLLHPRFVDMVAYARELLPDMLMILSTNGLLFDDEYASRLAKYGIGIYVSTHRPEKAGPAIEVAKKYGILMGTNDAAANDAFDWAGQVKWFVSASKGTCDFLKKGWAVVLADGSITTCCLDASGAGIVGHVEDEIGSVRLKPFSLCGPCHLTPPQAA